MKCRTCGNHASRAQPCTTCMRMTCFPCMIEGRCPDCWTAEKAREMTESMTPEYLEKLTKYMTTEGKTC